MHVSSPLVPVVRLLVSFALVLALACAFPSPLSASGGDQMQMDGDDLQIFVDYRWAGTIHGGYYPIRIQVLNNGPDCQLTFRFKPFRDQQLPTVERRDLPVGSGKKATITLSVPMVGRGGIGNLEIERDGELLDQLTRQISLSYADYRSLRASVLIVSPTPVQVMQLEQGIHYTANQMDVRTVLDQLVIEPLMLPSAWADYTGVDFIMIPMRTLADLESGKRSAILQWVQTGGTLLIYDVGEPPETPPEAEPLLVSPELEALINLPEPRRWEKAVPQQRLDVENRMRFQMNPQVGGGALPEESEEEQLRWPFSPVTFVSTKYLLGRIYAFRHHPFPGTRTDWAWWLSTVPEEQSSWVARQGVLPRRANENFFNFLIPGVTSVPVYAFLVLMTLFTIVIGPLNYILLRRRKRTYLLLLTIPVIAFVTSLTLFLYSTLAYGFSVASRSRSLTVLDQRTNTAVSLSRISLFAGMAPSEGLEFSPDTAVFPMWAPLQFGQSQFESGRVVWGEKQKLTDGWLRSRTRTQFATVQHRTERGRLEIETASGNTLTISNGLEWDIEAILWRGDDGNFYQGKALGAGNTGELVRVDKSRFSAELQEFQEVLQRNEMLEFPDDIEDEKQVELGLMESKIQQLLRIKDYNNLDSTKNGNPEILKPRTYLAVLAARPGIELGLEDTDERAGYHLLLGYY